MASNSEEEESLEAAVAGIPRIADAVAANPDGVRAKVLEAVENSYRQAAHDLGYDEERVQSWVSTIMLRLQAELERRESAKQKVLERGKKPRAMAGRTRRRSSRQPNLKAIGSGSL
jgi:DNA-directed RNA polymerase specialized sigma24 family protein